MKSNHGKIPPCQYFFSTTCNLFRVFIFYKKKNVKKKKKKYNCNKSYCYHCRDYKKKSHCYIKPIDIKKEKTVGKNENNLMVPFYCVVQNVCKKCERIEFKNYSFEVQDKLECCGVREFVFDRDDVVNGKCEFILLQKHSVWVAHNSGRFDTIFIFKFLSEQKQI